VLWNVNQSNDIFWLKKLLCVIQNFTSRFDFLNNR